MAKLRTRAQWARRIRAAHRETIGAVLKLGRLLSAAKKSLPHGEFLKMIERDLPFKASTAQRLMKIASDPKIANAARAQLLPSSWNTVYELTKLPTPTFERATALRIINPKMTRADAKKIIPLVITQHETPKRASSVVHLQCDAPDPPMMLSLTLLEVLRRLEQAIADLAEETIPQGSDSERRVRRAAAKLLSLVDQGGQLAS